MVYDLFGNPISSSTRLYDLYGNPLNQAYSLDGTPLFAEEEGTVISVADKSTGTNSGLTLVSGKSQSTYVLRSLIDFSQTNSDWNYQSCVYDEANHLFYKFTSGTEVVVYNDSGSVVNRITLPSTGGHKNDSCFYNGKVYMLDGTASDSKALFVWDISQNTVSRVDLPISNNANGSLRVVAGITLHSNGRIILVSRDKYGDSDVLHQNGDVLAIYSYDPVTNSASLLASLPWDCVYVQGATLCDGILYVACNTQTTGEASNYQGITVKCIRSDTWELYDELTVSGNFEPQGMDNIPSFSGDSGRELTTGIGHWGTYSLLTRFTPPYALKNEGS